jgi:hypothetical protein
MDAFSEKYAMSVPDRMARCRLRPFENEKARNEHRVWLELPRQKPLKNF